MCCGRIAGVPWAGPVLLHCCLGRAQADPDGWIIHVVHQARRGYASIVLTVDHSLCRPHTNTVICAAWPVRELDWLRFAVPDTTNLDPEFWLGCSLATSSVPGASSQWRCWAWCDSTWRHSLLQTHRQQSRGARSPWLSHTVWSWEGKTREEMGMEGRTSVWLYQQ